MSKKTPEHAPRPAYRNEEGIAATMARFGMTETEAGRYLTGEWAEWQRVEKEHKQAAVFAETRRNYESVGALMSQLPPELDAKRVCNSEGRGHRVDVNLSALARMFGSLNA